MPLSNCPARLPTLKKVSDNNLEGKLPMSVSSVSLPSSPVQSGT